MNPLRRPHIPSTQQHFAAQLPLSQRVLSGFWQFCVLWGGQSPEKTRQHNFAVGTEAQGWVQPGQHIVGVSIHVLKTHCKRVLSLLSKSGSSFRAKFCSKWRGLLVRSHVPYQGTQPVRPSRTQCWKFFHLHLRARLSGFLQALPLSRVPSTPFAEPCQALPWFKGDQYVL